MKEEHLEEDFQGLEEDAENNLFQSDEYSKDINIDVSLENISF